MALIDLLEMIDGEIAKLQAARALLVSSGSSTSVPERRKPGRPAKSEKAMPMPAKPKKKRNLTPEGRARIVAAVKRRWAAK
jgi:hypothetical protein